MNFECLNSSCYSQIEINRVVFIVVSSDNTFTRSLEFSFSAAALCNQCKVQAVVKEPKMDIAIIKMKRLQSTISLCTNDKWAALDRIRCRRLGISHDSL